MTQPHPDWPHEHRFYVFRRTNSMVRPSGVDSARSFSWLQGALDRARLWGAESWRVARLVRACDAGRYWYAPAWPNADCPFTPPGADPIDDPQPTESPDDLAEIRADLASLRAEVEALREGREANPAEPTSPAHLAEPKWLSILRAFVGRATPRSTFSKAQVRDLLDHIDERAQRMTQVRTKRDELASILRDLLGVVDESRGIAGWHLSGDVAPWSSFPAIGAARRALDGLVDD